MTFAQAAKKIVRSNEYSCSELKPARPIPSLTDDARAGLLERPRSLAPKYFYDDYGSKLFDQICDTAEYYPTRVEAALLQEFAATVINVARPEYVVELGSGTSRKTRHLLDACSEQRFCPEYWPMDVCESILDDTAESLMRDYAWLNINAFVGDYHGGFEHLPPTYDRTLYVFLGGTIGNFEHAEAVSLLSELRGHMCAGDYILLGFDRVKDSAVLEAAYNDAQGITAAFNLNVLRVLNRELKANFQLDNFLHQATYNQTDDQIEMYLVSGIDQTVHIPLLGRSLEIKQDEQIRTEISRKFTPESIESLLNESGLSIVKHRQAENAYYSLVLAQISQ